MFIYNIASVVLFSLGEGPSLRPRSSPMIHASKWSIGTETMDRNLTIYSNYERFIEPLGAKRARLQGGWHRCDPNGTAATTGEYNWGWLDQAVFGIHAKGIKPWIELSYGNAAYPGGGGNGPGAWIPNTTVALAAFGAWAEALVARYSNVTDEFEVWNEPRLTPSNYQPYARLAATACIAAHKGAASAHARVGPPQLFFGVMSGGYVSSGVAFLNGTLPLLDRMLREGDSGLELKDCVAAVTYHAYTSGPPEETHARRFNKCGTAPAPCSGVEALHAALTSFVPSAYVFQGETGAPARWSRGGAMEPRNWTEVQQMKWNLRSMVGDAAHPIVRYSSLFTLMDVCYHAAANNIGWYGLLASSCAPKVPGSGVADNKTVDHVRPSYRAAQSIYTLFDDDVVPVLDAVLRFQCERNATNSGTDVCRLDGDNATSPRTGMHCDLKVSTSVAHYPTGNEMASPKACRQKCCGVDECNCWTWSTRPENSGCWLKHYPNSSMPLVPAEKGLSGGKVRHSNSSTPPFNPTGYAFRNRTAATQGITHVVVWDALPQLQDADRKTRCNVSVGIFPNSTTTSWRGSPRRHGYGDVLEQQRQRRQWVERRMRQKGGKLRHSMLSRSDALGVLVVLGNGSITATTTVFPDSPSETIRFPVELYDAPMLFARSDALPI